MFLNRSDSILFVLVLFVVDSNNNYYKSRNNNQKGRIHYEWFKDSINRKQYKDRMKKGVCVLCGGWKYLVYKCLDIKDSGKV